MRLARVGDDLSTLVQPIGVEDNPPSSSNTKAAFGAYLAIEDFVSALEDSRAPVSTGATALAAEWVMEQAARSQPA